MPRTCTPGTCAEFAWTPASASILRIIYRAPASLCEGQPGRNLLRAQLTLQRLLGALGSFAGDALPQYLAQLP